MSNEQEAAKAAKEMFSRYRSAVRERDAAAFLALYADDVRIFDAFARWQYEGLAEWRGMVGEWFGTHPDEVMEVEAKDLRQSGSGDVVAAHGLFNYRVVSPQGRILHQLDNRVSWVLVRAGGNWRIAHEHTSVPVSHESMTAVPVPG